MSGKSVFGNCVRCFWLSMFAVSCAIATLVWSESSDVKKFEHQYVTDDVWVDHTDMLRYNSLAQSMSCVGDDNSALETRHQPNKQAARQNSCCNPLVNVCRSVQLCCQECLCPKRTKPPGRETATKYSHSCESMFMTRYVRRLLMLFNTNDDSEMLNFDVKIMLSRNDLEMLKLYVSSKGSLHDVDHVLSHMIKVVDQRTWVKDLNDALFVEQWKEFLPKSVFHVSVIIILLILWYNRNSGYKRLTINFFLALFIVSTAWEWQCLYQKAEAEKLVRQAKFTEIPKECNPNSMTYYDAFLASFKVMEDDTCLKYHETMIVDTHLEITPFLAAVNVLSKPLPLIMSSVGDGLTKYFSHFTEKFSFFTNMVMIPLATLIILAFLKYPCTAAVQASLGRLLMANQHHGARQMVEDVSDRERENQPRTSPAPGVIEQHHHHYYLPERSSRDSQEPSQRDFIHRFPMVGQQKFAIRGQCLRRTGPSQRNCGQGVGQEEPLEMNCGHGDGQEEPLEMNCGQGDGETELHDCGQSSCEHDVQQTDHEMFAPDQYYDSEINSQEQQCYCYNCRLTN